MKFREKPVIVDAVQWKGTQESFDEILSLGDVKWTRLDLWDHECFYIKTHEGQRFVFNGDWIIKDAHGEFHICKPDIFEQTYDALSD